MKNDSALSLQNVNLIFMISDAIRLGIILLFFFKETNVHCHGTYMDVESITAKKQIVFMKHNASTLCLSLR